MLGVSDQRRRKRKPRYPTARPVVPSCAVLVTESIVPRGRALPVPTRQIGPDIETRVRELEHTIGAIGEAAAEAVALDDDQSAALVMGFEALAHDLNRALGRLAELDAELAELKRQAGHEDRAAAPIERAEREESRGGSS